ncbi:MAG: glycine dehydrogenase [Ilumatobacteraceae bacterium]|jgi:glycine dehydrogenase
MRAHLDELIDAGEFTRRHTAPTADERARMLEVIGEDSVQSLLAHTVPESIRMEGSLALDASRSPESVLGELRRLADQNISRTSLIGMGYYGTITPPVIVRNVVESPAWYTAYTPYQPEISQGRLEALLNFQTMVAEITGFDLANASLLDEATAAAEAMTMCRRLSKSESHRFLVHHDTHPQTIAVLATRAEPVGIDLVVGGLDELANGCFGALFSLPTSSGAIIDWAKAIASVHHVDGLAVVGTDLMACMLAVPPAHLGADIAIGSAQRFGVSMGFGGPHAAFIAASESIARALPGRLVGISTDTEGRPAMRLALQTREQHIRREKATSNICTAQVLLANIAGFYAAWHGPEGLRRIAERIHRLASMAAGSLRSAGFELVNETWFDTLQVRCDAIRVLADAAAIGLDLRLVDDATIGFSFDETSTTTTLTTLLSVFGVGADVLDTGIEGLPRRRKDEFLTQSVFSRYHTEHEMLRYLRRLSDKDLALDRTMIPLGSCTMKLNATVEMEPLTWPGLADMHPFTPEESTIGIRAMITQLEAMLAAITGYDAVSLQPNAGSQGEFAGLLAIHAYHRSRGDTGRDVCLIPSSAHGTNAASAVMAGLKVVVVRCDEQGNIDLADLESKAATAGDALAAAMVTYPSTHGVFEAHIGELCEIVHRHGGQVYVDGANLNAMVGLAQPGKFGADVSHLNLHKTFCIPHGGGGPGVGPVAVRAHLAEFLPAHPLASAGRPVGAVSAAPFGSASILAISWVYIALMGAGGLADASAMAVLNANYVATRLDPHFPVLYTGEHGRVAHECIIDLRPITKATGVTVDDVAKRLIDYGFHAPTMSFPVAGTLMIEPTESESLSELDRFCSAMIAIRHEIDEVASGTWKLDESPLRNAPHTAEDLIGEWKRPYDRQLGAYPVAALRAAKYFPPVSRIDAAYGDRNLICSCEPLEVLAATS